MNRRNFLKACALGVLVQNLPKNIGIIPIEDKIDYFSSLNVAIDKIENQIRNKKGNYIITTPNVFEKIKSVNGVCII
jgi:hypothetical protein